MLNIYIKSFNRPFYLDRCIRSVKFNAIGHQKIVVLDDGTEQKYLDHLQQLHPDVEFRSSGADDGKMELLRQEKFSEINNSYPSAMDFWIREVSADEYDYCFIIEDDAWLTKRVDLLRVLTVLRGNSSVICKFWWSIDNHKVGNVFNCPGGLSLEEFIPEINSLADVGEIWIVAFAIFLKEYWVDCVSSAKRLGDERSQQISAYRFLCENPSSSYYKSGLRAIHQGWVIPARSTSEYYDKGLRQHIYMDALNEAWINAELDPMIGYPYDFPSKYILSVLNGRISRAEYDVWESWQNNDIKYYYD